MPGIGGRLPVGPGSRNQRTRQEPTGGAGRRFRAFFRPRRSHVAGERGGAMGEGTTACRGVRGAITVEGEGPEAVEDAVGELIEVLLGSNGIGAEDLAAAIFTVPDDLIGANPAAAARAHGWSGVPLLMVREHGG